MANIEKEPSLIGSDERSRLRRPLTSGEAAMASIGMDYSTYPSADEVGVRVPIPHHPEIVAYRMRGGSASTRDVDELIALDKAVKAKQESGS